MIIVWLRFQSTNFKLTFRQAIDENTINKAKSYAHDVHISLSKLVEQFLRSLNKKNNKNKISSDIHDLRGVYKTSKKIDDKKVLLNALKKKHL